MEIWIGLGSNLGDRRGQLQIALGRLSQVGEVGQVSDIYETEPWGRPDQPRFLNAVCSLFPRMDSPFDLWSILKQIEREAGRTPGARWGPRLLDLDLLFWSELRIQTEQLTVPHPRLMERRFVLQPLVQVAPKLVHPVLGLTVLELLERCPDSGAVEIWGKFDSITRAEASPRT